MGDRIEDFDFTSEVFLRHKQNAKESYSDYFNRKSVAFAESFAGRQRIYLDTKFWVKLRNAAVAGGVWSIDSVLLAKLRELVSKGVIVCPFSSILWFEGRGPTPIDKTASAVEGNFLQLLDLRLLELFGIAAGFHAIRY